MAQNERAWKSLLLLIPLSEAFALPCRKNKQLKKPTPKMYVFPNLRVAQFRATQAGRYIQPMDIYRRPVF